MIIYMECTLNLLLATGTPREEVDRIIRSGQQKAANGTIRYVIVNDMEERHKFIKGASEESKSF